jgi:transcriptional regulator with XRE-family HTH domain/KaiC/GvpD/RAD55 family RecA-like ATPase
MQRLKVTSGVERLDELLDGLYIGDNVVWYDDAGSLATVFCENFIRVSLAQGKALIYVSFDRSPRNLIEKLGPLAHSRQLILMDCFTFGKGAGSDIFLKFYGEGEPDAPCKLVRVEHPLDMQEVMSVLYGIHETLTGDVRLVFESVTGMQGLWGGEEQIIRFYSHSCPRLYELNTIAYWLMEKKAHSQALRARINQVAQVAVELSVKRGNTSLMVLKAEKRTLQTLNKPFYYRVEGNQVTLAPHRGAAGGLELGGRLKTLRTTRGFSQTELAKQVGVTPSTISQIESGLIYPSLPALFKIAETLSVSPAALLQGPGTKKNQVFFPGTEAVAVRLPHLPESSVKARMLTPVEATSKATPYLIEIPPMKVLPIHFLTHRGEDIGYVLEGTLRFKMGQEDHTAKAGDLIYLTDESPEQWENPGPGPARLLWVKISP